MDFIHDLTNISNNNAQETYQAIVNAIIPRTPELAYEYGIIQYYGALDLQIEDYIMITFQSLDSTLPETVAEMFEAVSPDFISLTTDEQLYILSLLRNLQINISELPQPFTNNTLLIISTINSLFSYTMMGYYSEWNGYGSTRMAKPNQRILEYYPLSWQQIGYPGPSLGYRALRTYSFT